MKILWKKAVFEQIALKAVETVPFHKILHQKITWNYGLLHTAVCFFTKTTFVGNGDLEMVTNQF